MTIDVGRVGMITAKDIVVEDRARQEMGDLDDFESNMKTSGMITPLTVMDLKDGRYRLLAGERRLTVISRHNGLDSPIPARIYDRELTPLEMKVIEKSENFHRKNFEYWELDKLTAEIHQMQQEIYGTKAPGPGQVGWSAQNTAEMLGYKDAASVTESIKRAKAAEAYPELFTNCKTASDASKLIKKLDEAATRQVIAEKLERQRANTTLSDLSKRFIVRDFFEGVKDIPDNYIHLVEIDPPYSIDLERRKMKAAESQYELGEYNEIVSEKYQKFLADTFRACYRVMAEHSWLICWFAPEPWFEVVYQELSHAGFYTSRMCGIWIKPTGQSMQPQTNLANSYEMFFYAWKGRPALNKAGRSNVFSVAPVLSQNKVHPTERPVELMEEIYNTFAFTGSRVLIPFLGSGNGILAAHKLGMPATGFEKSKSYKDSFLIKANSLR